MNTKIVLNLIIVLFLAVSCAGGRLHNCVSEDLLCDANAWSIFFPDDQGKPAANIDLLNLQYWSDDGKMGHDISSAQIDTINKDVRHAAAIAFGKSTAKFEVMIRFTINIDQPSTVELVYKDAGITEYKNLDIFKKQLLALTDYRSTKGKVYVVFHYLIRNANESNELQYIKKPQQ